MSIQYIPQGIPVVSSSVALSGSHAIRAGNSALVLTASVTAHALNAIGPIGHEFITASAPSSLIVSGSQGLSILVASTGSLNGSNGIAFKLATSSFSTEYGPNVGPIDNNAYNPTINLISGSVYRFLVRGTPPTPVETVFSITNAGSGAYLFDIGASGSNATLTLIRGYRYEFRVNAVGHPFHIQTTSGAYNASAGVGESGGVYNSGSQSGTIIFNVPHSAPNTLYYVCQFHSSMAGTINIVNDGSVYGFRIQSTSGQNGTPYNTGVTNNNIASGSLKFEVSASVGTTLYYASPSSSTMNGIINIVS